MLTSIINVHDLEKYLKHSSKAGVLFCFGTSFISRLIQAKTKLYPTERVPSHVALIYSGFIYESTTESPTVNKKHIPPGVRRWLLSDFMKSEKKKQTSYAILDLPLEMFNEIILEESIHLPYGKDTILDFVLKDGSDGDSSGLICSQYANMVVQLLPLVKCPTPADLYRKAKEIEHDEIE